MSEVRIIDLKANVLEDNDKKAEELRKMSKDDLNKQLNELKEELFRLRFQLQINQLDNPNKIPETKRNIARVLTVLNEKN